MKFSVNRGDFSVVADQIANEAERAVSRAMNDVAQGLKNELRAQVISAGLGARLAGTWRGTKFPVGRDSINSAAFVESKAPALIDAFDRGAVIRASNGFYLAIPTPAAGAHGISEGGRRKRVTPSTWERRTGIKLRLVVRRGRPALLVADDVRMGKYGIAKLNVGRRKGKEYVRTTGRATIVIFILLRQVTLRKRLDVEAAANHWAAEFGNLLNQHWN